MPEHQLIPLPAELRERPPGEPQRLLLPGLRWIVEGQLAPGPRGEWLALARFASEEAATDYLVIAKGPWVQLRVRDAMEDINQHQERAGQQMQALLAIIQHVKACRTCGPMLRRVMDQMKEQQGCK